MRTRDGRRQGRGKDVDKHTIQTTRGGRAGRGRGGGMGKWHGSAGGARAAGRTVSTNAALPPAPPAGGATNPQTHPPPTGSTRTQGGSTATPSARPNGTTKPKRRPPVTRICAWEPTRGGEAGGVPGRPTTGAAGAASPPRAQPYRGAAEGGGGAPGGLPRRRNPGERGGRRPAALQLPRSRRGAAASGCRQERAALRLSGRPTQPSDLPLLSSAADAPPRPMNQR